VTRVTAMVNALPVTTEELRRLRNAGKITFDRMVDAITTCLIDMRAADSSPDETPAPRPKESDWHCTHCGRDNDPSETHCVHCEWSRRHTIAGVLHERDCTGHPCRCGAVPAVKAAATPCPHPAEFRRPAQRGYYCAQCGADIPVQEPKA
jgi:DNA-directed RNA polymerase subunit RPC12/RpoP